jgi:hypothetical protein
MTYSARIASTTTGLPRNATEQSQSTSRRQEKAKGRLQYLSPVFVRQSAHLFHLRDSERTSGANKLPFSEVRHRATGEDDSGADA